MNAKTMQLDLNSIHSQLVECGLPAEVVDEGGGKLVTSPSAFITLDLDPVRIAIFFKSNRGNTELVRFRAIIFNQNESRKMNRNRLDSLIEFENQNASALGVLTIGIHGLAIEYALPFKHSTACLVTAIAQLLVGESRRLHQQIAETKETRRSYWNKI